MPQVFSVLQLQRIIETYSNLNKKVCVRACMCNYIIDCVQLHNFFKEINVSESAFTAAKRRHMKLKNV